MSELLSVKNLTVRFNIRRNGRKYSLTAVNNVSLAVQKKEIVGLVGESGSGKSTLGRSIMRLNNPIYGTINFANMEIATLKRRELGAARRRMQMIFQDPHGSLNPWMRILDIIAEPLLVHGQKNQHFRRTKVEELMASVRLDASYMTKYPHELSGGQKQRVAIARALATDPEFIVADEPVSALDVSVQAQIVNLLAEIQANRQVSMLFISHDLAVVRHLADTVAVMYLGTIVETGPAERVLEKPLHPYTKLLIDSVPVPDPSHKRPPKSINGEIPSLLHPPNGCPFHTRCPIAESSCSKFRPPLEAYGKNRSVACLKI